MSTMQDLVDLARIPLNDARKVRYPDTRLLRFANSGLRRAFEIRPDLKFGTYDAPYADLVLAAAFPLDDRFLQTVADYVSGRAELQDDDNVNSTRAQALLQLFVTELSQ